MAADFQVMQEESIKCLGKYMSLFQILWDKTERMKSMRNPWRKLREMNPLFCQGYTSGGKILFLNIVHPLSSLKSADSSSYCPMFHTSFQQDLDSPKLLGNDTGWGSGCSLPGAARRLQHSCLEAIFPHSWKSTTRRNNLVQLDNRKHIGPYSLMVHGCAVQYNRSGRKPYYKQANSYFVFRSLSRSFSVAYRSMIRKEQLVHSI